MTGFISAGGFRVDIGLTVPQTFGSCSREIIVTHPLINGTIVSRLHPLTIMDSATQQVEQQRTQPSEDDIYHPPRPSAESRFYTVTVGKKTGVYQGGYVLLDTIDDIAY